MTLSGLPELIERLAAAGTEAPRDDARQAFAMLRSALSEGTVRNYLSEAMTKLGASTRLEAARIARDNGWL